jgi:polyisoprenoid-binding protein YceI
VRFSGSCRVFTYKEGALSTFGHDLELEVRRFTIEGDDTGVQADFDAASLEVVAAIVDGRPRSVSAHDRASIERTIVDEVLQARRWPRITFRSTAISPDEVRGTLTLCGRSREIVCPREGERAVSCRLHQPDFGIKPYRAMLGALRVQADVLVKISLG